MRSDLIFGALTHVNNRYELCQLASKATRKLHKPNTRLQDTTNEVLDRFKDTIRAKTRRTRGDSLARIIADLNRTLGGWFAYFKHAHPRTFLVLDKFIRRRLRAVLRKQDKRPGFGATHDDHQRWPLAFFANAGLLALHTAWQDARHSR